MAVMVTVQCARAKGKRDAKLLLHGDKKIRHLGFCVQRFSLGDRLP